MHIDIKSDDILQRVSVLFIIGCLFGLTTNITQAFSTTYSQLLAFYVSSSCMLNSQIAYNVSSLHVSLLEPTTFA
jgi:hypothetical protein